MSVNSVFLFLSIADIGYFQNSHRRLSFEIFSITGDIAGFLPELLAGHYVYTAIAVLVIAGFCCISWKIAGKREKTFQYQNPLAARLLSPVIIILLAIIMIRGGFQLKPLRPADAFLNDNSVTGYLVLNTPYSIIQSGFQDDIEKFSFMPKEEAVKISRSLFADTGESFVNDDYVFMRKKNFPVQNKKYNVVVLIMESWSSLYCGSITGQKTFTPFFDSIAAGGMLYTNFFASGFRSIEALPSILVSVPSVFNSPIINSSSEINNYRGLGTILTESGYSTSFHHGAETGSMGFSGFSKISGFEKYFGMEDFGNSDGRYYDGVWGIYDEPFFLKSVKDFNGFKEPFCSIIFSLSSHDPFKIPEDAAGILSPFKDESESEISVRYSDHSLEKFFEAASREKWFANTIFLITADHTFYVSRYDLYSQFHIPMLIYSPGNIPEGRNNRIFSHADILPTVINLLGLNTVHSSMGRSLLSNSGERYAFEKFGSDYCIVTDSLILFNDFSKPYRLYNYIKDPETKINIESSFPETAVILNHKLKAFLQTSSDALKSDRIYSAGK